MLKILISATLVACSAASAWAFPGDEMMRVLDHKDRSMYLAGMADMAGWNLVEAGETDRADCVSAWFYGDNGSAQSQMEQLFERYPDVEAGKLFLILMERHCPVDIKLE